MSKLIAGIIKGVIKAASNNTAKQAATNTTKTLVKNNVTKQSFSSLTRNGAFRKAKEVNGIPRPEQPINVTSNHINRQGKIEQGRLYTFKNGKFIRDDAKGHIFKDDPSQNRGPHFNDQNKNHFDYPRKFFKK